jgi:Flp pilus assembly protein protease CpaA
LVAWTIIFGAWKLNIMGGGDAKLTMVLFALFPTYNFVLTFCLVALAALLPLLVLQHWGKRPFEALGEIAFRLQTGLFPTRQELERKGKQYAWVFCLPGVIYLWLLW